MEKLADCPICGSNNTATYITSKDYFLTGEIFTIEKCPECQFLFTNPRPSASDLLRYYESPDYISHDTGKKGLLQIIYRSVRKLTVRNKVAFIARNTSEKKILDIGCGTGEFLNGCKLKGFQTTGIEPSPKVREFAKATFGLEVFEESFLEQLPLHSFDVITMWHVLEHVPDLNGRMKKITELIKENGKLVIALPNCASPDAEYFGEYWASYDLPRHIYHFNKNTFNKLAEKHRIRIEKIVPMKWDAFYISILSEKYKSGSTNYLKALFNGLKSNRKAARNQNNFSSLIYICKIAQD